MKEARSNPLSVALIRAGRDLPPSPSGAFERTLVASTAALGVAAGLGAAAATAEAATLGSPAAIGEAAVHAPAASASQVVAGQGASALGGAASGAAPVAAAKGTFLLAPLALTKPIGVGLLLGSLGMGAVGVGQYWGAKDVPRQPATPAAPSAVVRAPLEQVASHASEVHSGVDTSPAGDVPAVGPAGVQATPSARISLLAEIRALDGARAALARGDRSQALRRVVEYRARFPQGQLAPEAELLEKRILGDQARAGRPSP